MESKGRSDQVGRAAAAPRPPEQRSPEVFHRAVEILRARHHVSESLAYAMLVHSAGEEHTSVRETAMRIIAKSLDTR